MSEPLSCFILPLPRPHGHTSSNKRINSHNQSPAPIIQQKRADHTCNTHPPKPSSDTEALRVKAL